jgi:hypothetical protein
MKEIELGQKESNNFPNVIPIAFAVGLITSFITYDSPGGLTGEQGFLVGILAVILFVVLIALMENYKIKKSEKSQIYLNIPENILVTRAEAEDGATIKLFLTRKS